MASSIKNPETERLARELAAATGETVTTAVTSALTVRLDALRAAGGLHDGRWGPDDRGDPAADLYDEQGLPR